MPPASDLALLQGTLDVLVLKALVFGPRHGYAVATWIRETSGETLNVEDRALYVALHMNPVDHPHGGGEGKSKGHHPVTPWGVPTIGKRTRPKHKESDKLIVRGRRRGKERR